jgi:hypothetical protein
LTSCGDSTRLEDLSRRGIRRVRVVRREQLGQLIERSLDRALECHLLALTDEERASILSGAIGDLDRRRRAEKGTSAWLGEFNDENETLGREILEAAQLGEPSFGLGVDLTALSAVIGAVGLTSVGETRRIAIAVAGFLRSEEERLRAIAAREQQQRVELLERRLSRLSDVLRKTEEDLQEALAHANTEEGIASIFKSIQGIRATQKDFERKRAMLSDIFAKNVKLRGDIDVIRQEATRSLTRIPAALP